MSDKKISFMLDEKTWFEVDALCRGLGVSSGEFYRDATTLMLWAVEAHKNNLVVGSLFDGKAFTEINSPILSKL